MKQFLIALGAALLLVTANTAHAQVTNLVQQKAVAASTTYQGQLTLGYSVDSVHILLENSAGLNGRMRLQVASTATGTVVPIASDTVSLGDLTATAAAVNRFAWWNKVGANKLFWAAQPYILLVQFITYGTGNTTTGKITLRAREFRRNYVMK